MTMARVTRHYVDGRFGQMHYRRAAPVRDAGRPPLLMFHMSPYSSVIYDTVMGVIGDDRLVIAVDTPGFGNSDPPPAPPEITDYAAAMGDVMDALALRNVDLLGFHTGSKIALELAIQRPNQVRKVVMVSAAIFTDAELAEHRETYGKTELTDDGSHLVKWWQSARRWSMKGRTLEQIARVFYARTMRPAISCWGHRAAFNTKTADLLPKVAQPILILNPEDDIWPLTPRARPLLRNGRIHDLPGWSHGFLDMKPREAAALIEDFLDAA
jgi:pimeloyl-ACP methyl ester carboxylesterase